MTSRWIAKAAVQGMISRLPGGVFINGLFQRYVTKSLRMTPRLFDEKLLQCEAHLKNYSSIVGTDSPPSSGLEIGTGWFPIIPVGLSLCGVGDVWTIDRTRLMNRRDVRRVLRMYANYAQTGALSEYLPGVSETRMALLQDVLDSSDGASAADMLERLRVHAVVGNARSPRIAPSSIDLITSTSTLEHIPADALGEILVELAILASNGAVMSHFIDIRDHYSYFDRAISGVNFLKYSDQAWGLYNNSLQYQNRLRVSDYRRLHEAAGFMVMSEIGRLEPENLLSTIQLADKFLSYSAEELLTTECWIVSASGKTRAAVKERPERSDAESRGPDELSENTP